MAEQPIEAEWYCVRTVFRFHFPENQAATYEERLTLWQVGDFPAAIALAEEEAHEYAGDFDNCTYIGFAQAYALAETPGHGAEVFSLMRDSKLTDDAYLNSFFDTGDERQGGDSEP